MVVSWPSCSCRGLRDISQESSPGLDVGSCCFAVKLKQSAAEAKRSPVLCCQAELKAAAEGGWPQSVVSARAVPVCLFLGFIRCGTHCSCLCCSVDALRRAIAGLKLGLGVGVVGFVVGWA